MLYHLWIFVRTKDKIWTKWSDWLYYTKQKGANNKLYYTKQKGANNKGMKEGCITNL